MGRFPKIVLLSLAGALLSGAVPAAAGSDRWPVGRERGVYTARLRDSEAVLWRVEWETAVTEGPEGRLLEIRESGAGKPWEYDQPVTWKKKMRFALNPAPVFLGLESTRRTGAGAIYNQQQVRVDPERRKMLSELRGEGEGPPIRKWLRWTEEVIPKEFMFHWTRSFDFSRREAADAMLLVSPTRLVRMEAEREGIEEVEVPAGRFLCHRLELEPELGLLKLTPAMLLVPEMTLWCTVEPPHFWVRYTGPVGGRGSPEAVIELVSFERGVAG